MLPLTPAAHRKWSSEKDLNLHVFRHRDLKPARLPIPPSEDWMPELDSNQHRRDSKSRMLPITLSGKRKCGHPLRALPPGSVAGNVYLVSSNTDRILVAQVGFGPTRTFVQRCLRPSRLPVPAPSEKLWHWGISQCSAEASFPYMPKMVRRRGLEPLPN